MDDKDEIIMLIKSMARIEEQNKTAFKMLAEVKLLIEEKTKEEKERRHEQGTRLQKQILLAEEKIDEFEKKMLSCQAHVEKTITEKHDELNKDIKLIREELDIFILIRKYPKIALFTGIGMYVFAIADIRNAIIGFIF